SPIGAGFLVLFFASAVAYGAGSDSIVWISSKPAGLEFTKSEITVSQYKACMNAGKCEIKSYDEFEDHAGKMNSKCCNLGMTGRTDHPINCVSWKQASRFCHWVGGSLPTKAEWTAEATNNDKREFPWGGDASSCPKNRATCSHAVVKENDQDKGGCGRGSTWPVCSKPAGNSISGLCDMVGNVGEWMSDSGGGVTAMSCGGSWSENTRGCHFDKHKIEQLIWVAGELECIDKVDDYWPGSCNTGFRCVRWVP
ncbi:MAG: SUMF1/EgtB/PvdO family nonheme iron enzyme, partial [Myxococcota bacterium]